MNTAERMRKYRARQNLRRALDRAEAAGVDLREVLDERRGREPVTPIGVTAGVAPASGAAFARVASAALPFP